MDSSYNRSHNYNTDFTMIRIIKSRLISTFSRHQGVIVSLIGLVMVAAFPALLLSEFINRLGGVGLYVFSTTFGVCVLVWGVYILRTSESRPLTPMRALWIPILVAVVFVVIDLTTRARLLNWWTAPYSLLSGSNIGLLAWSFPRLEFIAGSTFAALGAAVQRRGWRAALPAIVLILSIIWLMYQQTHPGQPVLAVSLVGIVPFIIGYLAATLPEDRGQ